MCRSLAMSPGVPVKLAQETLVLAEYVPSLEADPRRIDFGGTGSGRTEPGRVESRGLLDMETASLVTTSAE